MSRGGLAAAHSRAGSQSSASRRAGRGNRGRPRRRRRAPDDGGARRLGPRGRGQLAGGLRPGRGVAAAPRGLRRDRTGGRARAGRRRWSTDSPRDPVHRAVLGLADGDAVAQAVPCRWPRRRVRSTGVLSLHRSPSRAFDERGAGGRGRAGGGAGLRARRRASRCPGRGEHHTSATADRPGDLRAGGRTPAHRRGSARRGHPGPGVARLPPLGRLHLSRLPTRPSRLPSRSIRRADCRVWPTRRPGPRSRGCTASSSTTSASSLPWSRWRRRSPRRRACWSAATASPAVAWTSLPDHAAAALYRIAQEALNNAAKHADARRAVVSLRRVGTAVVLAVSDDGVGFDAQKVRSRSLSKGDAEHYGLSSIAERCALIGAALRIDSVEGRGTAVIVERRGGARSGRDGPVASPSTRGRSCPAGRPARPRPGRRRHPMPATRR